MKFKKALFVAFLSVFLYGASNLQMFADNKQVKPPIPPVITQKQVLEGMDQFSIMNPTFSKDSKYLAAFFNGEKVIRIYDTQTGNVLSELGSDILYNEKFVDGMAFTGEQNSKLIVMRAEAPLKVIDWKTKTVEKDLDLGVTGYKITDFAFTPDMKYLVVGKVNGIDVWDYQQSQKAKSFLDGQKINSVDISSDAKLLVFAKAGKPDDSVGAINLDTLTLSDFSLSGLGDADKQKVPAYEVQMVDFVDGYSTIAGYLNLPAGTYKPDGPAGVYLLNLNKKSFAGPRSVSDFRLALAEYIPRFRGLLTSAFNFGQDGSITSALDFINPYTMEIMKTYPSKDFKAPFLAVGISPDATMMAAALKESDGVKLYLFNLSMPKQ